jgi:hypothetical protein
LDTTHDAVDYENLRPDGGHCRHLSLSTNNIEKISNLTGMENLKILSLGRNQIKKLENMDAVSDTLEELWISYNLLDKLVNPQHDHDIFPPRVANIAHPLMLET